MSYQKRTSIYAIGGAAVSLDEVENLGQFCEVEATHDHVIEAVARTLGLDPSAVEQRGYARLVKDAAGDQVRTGAHANSRARPLDCADAGRRDVEWHVHRRPRRDPPAHAATKLIDRFTAALGGGEPAAPVGKLVGFRPTSIQTGRAVFELEAGPQHANPMGTPHGGVICDVADASMGTAYASTLGEDESFATLELKINFLRPFWNGTLTATARFAKIGGTVGLAECDVSDTEGRLVARAM